MMSRPLLRMAAISFVVVLASVSLVTASAIEPLLSRVAEAQSQTGVIDPGAESPSVPGVDFAGGADGSAEVTEAAPATPPAPVLSTEIGSVSDVPEGGTTTASLGGSDVAVASVGGSYQIDAPHKKKRRSSPPVPQP